MFLVIAPLILSVFPPSTPHGRLFHLAQQPASFHIQLFVACLGTLESVELKNRLSFRLQSSQCSVPAPCLAGSSARSRFQDNAANGWAIDFRRWVLSQFARNPARSHPPKSRKARRVWFDDLLCNPFQKLPPKRKLLLRTYLVPFTAIFTGFGTSFLAKRSLRTNTLSRCSLLLSSSATS